MKTKNRKSNSRGAFLTIDEWQDDEPITGSWFDSPLMGTVGVIVAVSVLFSLSFMSAKAEAYRREQAREEADAELKYIKWLSDPNGKPYESESFDQALNGLNWVEKGPSLNYFANQANFDPSKKPVVQEKILKLLTTEVQGLGNMKVFSVWFDTEDHRRISGLIEQMPGHERNLVKAMSNLPNPVPALISELSQHSPTSQVYSALQDELRNNGLPTEEILRQLANKIRSTNNPKQFERFALVINDTVWHRVDDTPTIMKQIAGAMASAGRNITTEQLDEMDENVAYGIEKFSQFPEISDLLKKLSATRHVKNREMPWAETESVESKVKLARKGKIYPWETVASVVKRAKDGKVHPGELLSYEDSELVQEFLWEGKLKGKSEFLNLKMSSNATSMRGFSKAGVSLIRANGYSAIDSLLLVVQKHSTEITRERVSDELLEKLDILLANKLKIDLQLPSSSSNGKRKSPRQMPASLNLAERLGGKQAALAIAKAGKKKPSVLKEFKGMFGAMIALNEPETYDMIVNAWLIHGNADGLKTIGEAIEPRFISRLQTRLKKLNTKDKSQRRAIHILMGALEQIGTSKSVPVLEQLTESKVVGFQKASAKALEMIRQRQQ